MDYKILKGKEVSCGNCGFLKAYRKTYICSHPDVQGIAKVKPEWLGCIGWEYKSIKSEGL
jgi:hypothetical protein